MEKSELLTLAREYATTEDLYDLLGIDALKAEDQAEVRRAWRKASLKYHPDKVGGPTGAGFDDKMKAKWELLERAREILSDPTTREAYVSARSAALQREQERTAMDAKRRAMIEDLEAREAAAKQQGQPKPANTMSQAEMQAGIERGRQIIENRKRLEREALERMRKASEEEDRLAAEKEADLERRLEESRQRKAAKEARRAAKMAHRARSQTPNTGEQTDAVPPKDDAAPDAPPPQAKRAAPARSAKMDALLAKLRAKQAEKNAQEDK